MIKFSRLIGYFWLSVAAMNQVFANAINDPCGGSSALLSLVDRPTKSFSACSVPQKQVLLEMGYQYFNLIGGATAQNYPQAELRIGLPFHNELTLFPVSYNVQSVAPRSGYSASAIALKHEIGYTEHWVAAIQGLLILPTGGGGFGSDRYDPTLNGILFYSFNPAWSLTMMLGISSQSLPTRAGGQHYSSINPDVVLSWQITDKLETYGEVYGQNRTGPSQGAGFNTDVGILYLFTPHLEMDIEAGHRLSGKLQSFNNYYGTGLSLLF